MKNKIYLSEMISTKGYPSHVPVTVISKDGTEMDGYITESQLSRIVKRAKSAGRVRKPKKSFLNRLFLGAQQ